MFSDQSKNSAQLIRLIRSILIALENILGRKKIFQKLKDFFSFKVLCDPTTLYHAGSKLGFTLLPFLLIIDWNCDLIVIRTGHQSCN